MIKCTNKTEEKSPEDASHNTLKLDFEIINQIASSRYHVFLVKMKGKEEYNALKIFPYQDEKPSQAFLNENRLSFLSHPNVIPYVRFCKERKSQHRGKSFNISYILMELAHYDFKNLTEVMPFHQDLKLIRTYFRQLIEGVEYLHSKGVAHMDLKLENILLGDDFKLKLSDFDSAFMEGDPTISGKGTKNWRAPEIKDRTCRDSMKADIYSCGIILFFLTFGSLPYIEKTKVKGYELDDLLYNDEKAFWDAQKIVHEEEFDCEENFKELFVSMVKKDPSLRVSIEEVKQSKWYQEPIYTDRELSLRMSASLLNVE